MVPIEGLWEVESEPMIYPCFDDNRQWWTVYSCLQKVPDSRLFLLHFIYILFNWFHDLRLLQWYILETYITYDIVHNQSFIFAEKQAMLLLGTGNDIHMQHINLS